MEFDHALRVLLVTRDRRGLRTSLVANHGLEVVGEVCDLDVTALGEAEVDAVVVDPKVLADPLVVPQRDDRRGVDRWLRAADRVDLLSPQERKVLRLLGDGHSNRRIAREMGVTERTTKEHTSRVLEKMGVESRLQAGLIAFAHRLRSDQHGH
jgi:DNA-binding CsgD family transcriptional regulator